MIRAGVPQSIAMRVTGHETDAMFLRYDITDSRDKLGALEAGRRFAERQPGEKPNVVSVRSPAVRARSKDDTEYVLGNGTLVAEVPV